MEWYEYLIVIGIPTITTAWVGQILKEKMNFLNTQIKSQQLVIDNLGKYISATGWESVQKYYDEFKVPSEKEITRFQLIQEYGKTPEEHGKIIEDYDELLNYFYSYVRGLNEIKPGFAKDRIINGLPKNAKYLRDIWEGG